MAQSAQNVKLNFLKGIACIGVVFIHITFPGIAGQIVGNVAAFAVPIFFMTAGYYAFGKNANVIKRRMFKIIKIFLYAYALYLLYNVSIAVMNHDLPGWFSTYFSWRTPLKYLVFCTIEFVPPLWYLIAMIEVYVFWYLIVLKGKEKAAVRLLPILFVLQVLLTIYCETMQLPWYLKNNFITRGMPWFLFGYYLHTDESEKLRTIDSGTLVIMAVIGCAIAVIPNAFQLPVKFGVIGYIPYSFALFTLTLKDSSKSICAPLELIGEKLSLDIYVYHYLIGSVVRIILDRILKLSTEGFLYLWVRPIIVLVLSIALSWIIYNCKKSLKERSA